MNLDNENSNVNPNESSTSLANQSGSSRREETTMNWRSPVFLAVVVFVVVLLVTTAIYLWLANPQPISQTMNTVIPPSFPTATFHSVSLTPTTQSPEKQAISNFESPVVMTPTDTFTPEAEFPELYPGLQWRTPEKGRILFITHTGEDIDLEGYHIESMQLKEYPKDFVDYYQEELARRGWTKTFSNPPPNGELHGFENNEKYIMVGVLVVSEEPLEYRAIVDHN